MTLDENPTHMIFGGEYIGCSRDGKIITRVGTNDVRGFANGHIISERRLDRLFQKEGHMIFWR